MNGWLLALLITAAIVGILMLVRFALRVSYQKEDLRLYFCVSRLRFLVYSSAKKKAGGKKPKKAKKKTDKKEKKDGGEAGKEKPKRKRSIGDILSLVAEAGGVVLRLVKRIRIEELRATVVAAGPDAAAAAITYGRIWAGVGTLHALLDNLVTLKRFDVDVGLDYESKKISAEGVLEIGFRNLYILAAIYGIVKALWGHRNLFIGTHGSPKKLAKKAAVDALSAGNAAQ